MSYNMREDGEGRDKNFVDSGGGKPKHFQYNSQKTKAGLWGTDAEVGDTTDNFTNHIRNTNKNPFSTGSNFSDNTRTHARQKAALDLDNVWSVRKNVRVTSDIKKGLPQTGKSFYSRHGTLGNTGQESGFISSYKRQKGLSSGEASNWNSGRIGYSYSDSKLNTGGTDLFGDEFDSDTSTGGLGKRKHSGNSSNDDFSYNILNRINAGGNEPEH